jgi:hypothetical protein
MKARQLIGGAVYPPDILHVMFAAFDDAWTDVAPEISGRPEAIDGARLSLATIVLSLSSAGHLDRHDLKTAAVLAFKMKHRLP